MRLLLLATFLSGLTFSNAFPGALPDRDDIHDFVRNDATQFFETVKLEYSDDFEPIVTYLCAGISYADLLYHNEDLTSIYNAICSNLPPTQRVDFSYFEECVQSGECLRTLEQKFVFGVDGRKFHALYDMARKTFESRLAHDCILDDSCSFRAEAESLESDWTTAVAECSQSQTPEQVDSTLDAIRMSDSYGDIEGGVTPMTQALTRCLKTTDNVEVKRATAMAIQRTATCSDEALMEIAEFLETGEPETIDIAMILVDKLVQCEENLPFSNRTFSSAATLERLLSDPSSASEAAIAVWEMMTSRQEEQEQFRRRRSGGVGSPGVLGDIVEGREKVENNGLLVKREWYFNDPITGNLNVNRVILMTSNDYAHMGVIKLQSKDLEFNIDQSISIVLESPLLAVLEQAIQGDNFIDIIQGLKDEIIGYVQEGNVPPFKVSLFISTIEVDPEIMANFVMEAMSILQDAHDKMKSTLRSETPSIWMKLTKTAEDNTEALKLLNFDVSVHDSSVDFSAGSMFGEVQATATYHEDQNDPMQSWVEIDGTVDVKELPEMWPEMYYSASGYWKPYESLNDAATRCEMDFTVRDQGGNVVTKVGSCSRPLFLIDANIRQPISSTSRIVEIKDIVKLNLTMDLGGNGIFQFMGSPKILSFSADVMGQKAIELYSRVTPKSVVDLPEDDVVLFLNTVFGAEIPCLSVNGDVTLDTKVFANQSSTNDVTIHWSANADDVIGDVIGQVSDVTRAVVNIKSCHPVENDIITSLIMTQSLEVPENWCYIAEVNCPVSNVALNFTVRRQQSLFADELKGISITTETSQIGVFKFLTEIVLGQGSVNLTIIEPFKANITHRLADTNPFEAFPDELVIGTQYTKSWEMLSGFWAKKESSFMNYMRTISNNPIFQESFAFVVGEDNALIAEIENIPHVLVTAFDNTDGYGGKIELAGVSFAGFSRSGVMYKFNTADEGLKLSAYTKEGDSADFSSSLEVDFVRIWNEHLPLRLSDAVLKTTTRTLSAYNAPWNKELLVSFNDPNGQCNLTVPTATYGSRPSFSPNCLERATTVQALKGIESEAASMKDMSLGTVRSLMDLLMTSEDQEELKSYMSVARGVLKGACQMICDTLKSFLGSTAQIFGI